MIELNNITEEIERLSHERYAATFINTDQIHVMLYYNLPTSRIQVPRMNPIECQVIERSVEYCFDMKVTNENLGILADQFLQTIIYILLKYEIVDSVPEINRRLNEVYDNYDNNHGNPDNAFSEYVNPASNFVKNFGQSFLHPISNALTISCMIGDFCSETFGFSDENKIRLNKFNDFARKGLRTHKYQIYKSVIRELIIVYCQLKKNFEQGNICQFTFNAYNFPAFISDIRPIHPIDSLGILYESLRRMANIVINGVNTNSYSNFNNVRDIYNEYMREMQQRRIYREGLEAIDQIGRGQNIQEVITNLRSNRIIPGSRYAETMLIKKATILAFTLMRMVFVGRGNNSNVHFDLFGIDSICNSASNNGENRVYDANSINQVNSNIIIYVSSKISNLENKRISRIGNFDRDHFVDSVNSYFQKISTEYEKKKNDFQQNISNSITELQRLAIVDTTNVLDLKDQLSLTSRIASMNLRPFKKLVNSYNKFTPIQHKYDEMVKIMKLVHFYNTTEMIMRDNQNVGISISINNFEINPIKLCLLQI